MSKARAADCWGWIFITNHGALFHRRFPPAARAAGLSATRDSLNGRRLSMAIRDEREDCAVASTAMCHHICSFLSFYSSPTTNPDIAST